MADSILAGAGTARNARKLGRAVGLWLLVILGSPLLAAEPYHPLYEFRGPAKWIEIAAIPHDTRDTSGAANGASILLFDRQVNVTAAGDEYYEHIAVKALNSAGVDAWSQLDISVDPTFQSLRIHWLRVMRDGEAIDQRQLARITATPEESDLRNRIYNGRYNVDVLLAGVRAGDVIEYAYTLTSRERLFPGHFSARLYTGWSSPVSKQRIRVRSPLDRPLHYQLTGSETAPEAELRGGAHELVLEWTNVASIAGDPDRRPIS